MKKILIVSIILFSAIFAFSLVSAEDNIGGNISVIDYDLTYGFSNGEVSSEYYYTGSEANDAYEYLVSAEGKITLNISNITLNDVSYADAVDNDFPLALEYALEDDDDDDWSYDMGLDLKGTTGLSEVSPTSISLDGDMLTVKFNGTPEKKFDDHSDVTEDWDDKDSYFYIFTDSSSASYNFYADLDDVVKVHL